jgi:hypothetical protein
MAKKKQAAGKADARSLQNKGANKESGKERSLRNLEKGMWKPGQSGNPRGRPPNESSLTALLRQELANTCPADQKGRTWKELIVEAMMRLAIKGNSTAINTVFERIEGKVKDEVDHSGTVKVVEIPATATDEDEWERQCQAEYERRNSRGAGVEGAAGPAKVAS